MGARNDSDEFKRYAVQQIRVRGYPVPEVSQAEFGVRAMCRVLRVHFSGNLNSQSHDIPADWADEPLLFLLREHFGLTGAKFGCGVGICGACTIILDGVATRACTTRAGDVDGLSVRMIEVLAEGRVLHPVQQAWLDLGVPQCGYCQAGQIMAAVALLEHPASTGPSCIAQTRSNA